MSAYLLDARIVILGCGNMLYGDDVFGSLVIGLLQRDPVAHGVKYIDVGTGGPRLLNLFNTRASPPKVIIIDTAILGKAPGTITVVRSDKMPAQITGQTTHGMKLGYEIREYSGECYLVLCEPKHLTFGKAPSKQLYTALEEARSRVNELIKEMVK